MKENSMEKSMIAYCAPTLVGMKSAGLFHYPYIDQEKVKQDVKEMNERFNERGVYIEALKWKEQAVLIYVYRKGMLKSELERPEAQQLLETYGYHSFDLNQQLAHLKNRLEQSDGFPHEIGAFLGYPLEDVKGFIEHKGANFKLSGPWKVYGNETEASRLFAKLKKCTQVCMQVFQEGRQLSQMVVKI